MHSDAKYRFLEALIEGPLDRPTGFAGGQPGWDHNVRYFLTLGFVEVWRGDDRTVATLTPEGEEHARIELEKRPANRPRGRPLARTGTFHDMSDSGKAILIERWRKAGEEQELLQSK